MEIEYEDVITDLELELCKRCKKQNCVSHDVYVSAENILTDALNKRKRELQKMNEN